jgi:hypothetical protein
MRKLVFAVLAAAALAAGARAGGAGIGVGESAPLPEAKDVVGLPGYGAKSLEGKVLYIEIFRTW